MNHKVFLYIFILLYKLSFGTILNVRVLADVKTTTLYATPAMEGYVIIGDGNVISDTCRKTTFNILLDGDSLILKSPFQNFGKFRKILFKALHWSSSLKIQVVSTQQRIKTYDDNFSFYAQWGEIRIINQVEMEDYISGVVESEAGTKQLPEYYKLQSILCRTYALAHLRRHETEDFHLCDLVHCQAYKSRTNNGIIRGAVTSTKGMVIVDNDLKLISAAFHSNCGGQTVNSEDVWTLPTSYLKSVKDTFCLKMPHASWQRKIPSEDWKTYLNLKRKYPAEDSSLIDAVICFPMQDCRSIFFNHGNLQIPLKEIRSDWQLKSTYFSIQEYKDFVLISGKGYGHGVGLCQEGAMRMAQKGYPYDKILSYYYQNVQLVNLSVLEFFQHE